MFARNVKSQVLFFVVGMKDQIETSNYADRINRVILYLHDHLDETDLDLNKLAEIACMSPYHWHRIYQAIHGETLASTVKRLRLLRAAGYLTQTSMDIPRIARKSGYPNVQSFTRVFRAAYGMPPARYRRMGSHTQFTSPKMVPHPRRTKSRPETCPPCGLSPCNTRGLTWISIALSISSIPG
jgi:AraC family transcriptional regulator